MGLADIAWVVVHSSNGVGYGKTGTFFLPKPVAELVRQGRELGEADDIVFGRVNSKQENGAIGILTRDVIDRKQLYQPAVVMALIPFCNPKLYFD
jgi:non-canonical (house-cleaning) NTP pyrophosphatase